MPSSIIFLALSQAPPALAMNTARSCPTRIMPARKPPRAYGPSRKPTSDRGQDGQQGRADQLLLGGAGADVDHAAVVRLLRAGPDVRVAELDAALP